MATCTPARNSSLALRFCLQRAAQRVLLLLCFDGVSILGHRFDRSGVVKFASEWWLVPPDPSNLSVSVLRVDGHVGRVSADISATDFGGYSSSWSLVWEDGETSPKVLYMQEAVRNSSETNRLTRLMVGGTQPPEAKGDELQSTYLVPVGRVVDTNSTYIYFDTSVVSTPDLQSELFDECLIYATRPLSAGRRDMVEVDLVPCTKPLVGAIKGTKFDFFNRRLGPIVWEPWESDTRCLVRKLRYLPNESAGDWDFYSLLLWPDANDNGISCICLRSSVLALSSFIPFQFQDFEKPETPPVPVYANHDALVIAVNEVATGSTGVTCRKGKACSIHFPWTRLDPTDIVFGSLSNCPSTCKETFSLVGIRFEAAKLPYIIDRTIIDSFESLTPIVLCLCRLMFVQVPPRFMGSLVVEGPGTENNAICKKGAHTCTVVLETVSPKIDSEAIRIVSGNGCSSLDRGSDGVVAGANINATYSTQEQAVYILERTKHMMETHPGIFTICWCRKSELTNCTFDDDFGTEVGDLHYVGPYDINSIILTFGQELVLNHFTGLGVTPRDKIRLMGICGIDDGSFFLEANASSHYGAYNFGVIEYSNIKAREYSLCWCQPSSELEQAMLGYSTDCSRGEDFAAKFGSVTFLCPLGYANQFQGECRPCLLVWERAGQQLCEADPVKIALLSLSLLWGAIAMFTMFYAMGLTHTSSVKGWFPFRVRGRRLAIGDVSLERGGVIITTQSPHHLWHGCGSFPVTFVGTGNRLLEPCSGQMAQFRVHVEGPTRLSLLNYDFRPVDSQIDTSMGLMLISPAQALIWTVFHQVPLLSISVVFGACGWITRLIFLGAAVESLWQLFTMFVLDTMLGLMLRLVRKYQRGPTDMQNRLHLYEKRLEAWNPMPKPCEHGPMRAVRAFHLLDMYEFFEAFIRNRTMYYIDPNITRPLTAAYRLSYAERIGPQMVQWFVSHYWGMQFRNFCEAIARHAITSADVGGLVRLSSKEKYFREKSSVSNLMGESWKNACYWICTFSNNQYRIGEELGGGNLLNSSFYLALHSDVCKGTCMILDELALPLTRSWCLFELLQTIQLKKHKTHFGGLLFCTSGGVLNYGATSLTVALNIGKQVVVLKLEDAEASSLDDKNMINSLVVSEIGSFETINADLREYIKSSLEVCKERLEADFDLITKELDSSEIV